MRPRTTAPAPRHSKTTERSPARLTIVTLNQLGVNLMMRILSPCTLAASSGWFDPMRWIRPPAVDPGVMVRCGAVPGRVGAADAGGEPVGEGSGAAMLRWWGGNARGARCEGVNAFAVGERSCAAGGLFL